jgi:alkylhydroperoxidase/carboxymuconolactone decarboxylase family protein YurZ
MTKTLAATLVALAATAALPAAAQTTTPAPPTISTGQAVDLQKHLQPSAPNVFVFHNPEGEEDKRLVAALRERAAASDKVGLRLVALTSADAPVAKQYKVTQTPTVLVFDRHGHETARGGKIEEVDAAVRAALQQARLKWSTEPGAERLPHIIRTMSLQPEWMKSVAQLAQEAHFSDTVLNRRTKEMIATYVSSLNRCKY